MAPSPSAPRNRRVVNWSAFLGTGVVIGLIAGVLLHLLGPAVPSYGMTTSVLFFAAFGALLGALAGGLAGVVADAVISRR